MKAAVIGVSALVVVALVVGGYFAFRPDSKDGKSGQTDYAARLESLCDENRKQTEALGRPSDIPISTFYPGTVRIGRAFLKDAKALTPPSEQAVAAKTFLQQRGLYYDGLEYAYQFLTSQNNAVAFQRIVEGAIANLVRAETAAKALGAPGCALRPFE
jgi:hypothetical protein